MVNVRKRGNAFQYQFEIAPVDGVRKYINKSGFKTKAEAEKAGIIAYNEYTQTGHKFTPNTMSYSDYLDYWLKEHCQINLKYHTIQAYSNIIKNHIKPRLGFYRLSQITTSTLQEFMNNLYVEKAFSKNFMKNILKVLKTSFSYATDVVGFVKENPALKVRIPRYDVPEEDPAHIFSKEEIQMILERFKNNHAFYYAILTAYYTGLRVSEVFALTWNDIDFEKKTLTVNKNILKKNQKGATHGRHISGRATTVWYFGTCKTQGSYRTIEIGDTLVNALKEYKAEQERDKEEYEGLYMKHYMKETANYYNNKPEIKILNAYTELEIPLPEANLVFVKHNGVFEGTDTCKYPFKIIHHELGINCRFYDLRGSFATICLRNGSEIKDIAEVLGHKRIETTEKYYISSTEEDKKRVTKIFEAEMNKI